MTSSTIIGQVITPLGLARRTRLVQPPAQRIGVSFAYRLPPPVLRHRCFALDALNMRRIQESWIPLDLEHVDTDTIGRVQSLELAPNGSLWMTGIAYGTLPDGPLYLSPQSTQRPDGSDLTLDGVALTRHPAQIELEPVLVLPGTLDRRRDWQLHERHAGIAERAALAVKQRKHDDPLLVVDTDAARADTREARELERMSGGQLRHGQPGRVLRVY
jgi:hypothetical protein